MAGVLPMRRAPVTLTPREQFEEDGRTGWRALCMDGLEWAAWRVLNPLVGKYGDMAARPCTDCLLGFAADMRAIGRCNGEPGGVVDEPEEEPMDLAMIPVPGPANVARRTALAVDPPPCASCAHEPVCALRAAFEGMAEIETTAPALPAGLRLELAAVVSCDFFLRDRTKPAPVRVLTSQERGQYRAKSAAHWTPERRAAQGERARLAAAARKAAG